MQLEQRVDFGALHEQLDGDGDGDVRQARPVARQREKLERRLPSTNLKALQHPRLHLKYLGGAALGTALSAAKRRSLLSPPWYERAQ